jgi:NTP pyrophosphatase (non-canonical NTP hydrolase)
MKHIDFSQYMELAQVTECSYEGARELLQDNGKLRLLHASMGIASEAGEINEEVKKHIFYGKQLDVLNLIEEAGDTFWYMALLFKYLNVQCPELEIMERNILKLKARYAGKFSQHAALNRDKAAEVKALIEGKL